MVLSLFSKKKTPEQKVKQPFALDMDLERQRQLLKMQRTLEEMREIIDVKYQKIDQKETKAKDLIREKKKNEAKRQLKILKGMLEEIAKQENMYQILEKTKIQLESTADTSKIVEILKDPFSRQIIRTEDERSREFIEELFVDQGEKDEVFQGINRLLDDLVDVCYDEEIEIMYKKYE